MAAEQHARHFATARRLLPSLQAVLDAVSGAHEVAGVDQFGWHLGHGLVLAAGEVEVLDLHRRLFKAEPLGVVVVEVPAACAHAADVQGHAAANGHHALLDVVAHHHRDEGGHVKLGHVLVASLGEAALDGFLEDMELPGIHPDREEAVSHLGGRCHAGWGNAGGIDGDVLLAVQDALQRLAKAGGAFARVRELIEAAIEGGRRLPGEDLLHDPHVLLQPGHRLAVGHAVPAFHHLRPGRAQATEEAPAGEFREAHGGHRRHGGRAGRHLHDGGADLDGLGLRQNPGCGGHGIRAISLRGPNRVIAQAFRMANGVHRQAQFAATVAAQDA